MKNIGYKEILAIVVFVIVLFFIFKPSKARKKGAAEEQEQVILTTTATDKKVKFAFNKTAYASFIKSEGYKDSSAYLKAKGLVSTDISKTCGMIYDAKGFFDDDEDKLYDVFRAIPNLTIFSMVSNIFSYIYKVNLRDYLINFMNEKEMSKLYKIIIAKYYL
jgi:hypothetical protein